MNEDRIIRPGCYRLSAILEDGDIDLFEGLWPISHGVSINSYFVKGEKGALIDLFGDGVGLEELLEELTDAGFSLKDVQYLVINHMEPDHTALIPVLKQQIPTLEVLCTEKASKLLKSFYNVDADRIVKTGDTLDLGGGKILKFVETPNLHWPETMMTYDTSTKVLFPCDAFGGFGAPESSFYDDGLTAAEKTFFEGESLRYYSNIVGAFAPFVEKALKQLETLGIEVAAIAPSHGIIWRKNPGEVIEWYRRFAAYSEGKAEPEVTVLWSSMYGNTEAVVDKIVEGLRAAKVDVNLLRVPQDHVSHVLAAVSRSKGLVLGMPTYEYKMFPPMAWALDLLGRKKVKNREVLRFGSFGWSGGAQKELEEIHEKYKLGWNFHEPLEWAGGSDENLLQTAFDKAKAFGLAVKEKAGK